MNVICRAGGWQGVTGLITVLRTYAHKVIDEYCDPLSIGCGRVHEKDTWDARLVDFYGKVQCPNVPEDPDAMCLPLACKIRIWRSEPWVTRVAQLSAECSRLMHAGMSDPAIMPVARYTEARDCMTQELKKPHNLEAAKALLCYGERTALLQRCYEDMIYSMWREAIQHDVLSARQTMSEQVARQLLSYVVPYHVGNVLFEPQKKGTSLMSSRWSENDALRLWMFGA